MTALLSVDPASEEQNDERERRRQRVHDAKRAPRGRGGARRVRFENCAPSQFADFQGGKHRPVASDMLIIERFGLDRIFAQDGSETGDWLLRLGSNQQPSG